ncbi:MAG: TIGR03960 family B12-binding radical SAM protein [Candidatus Eisenbacteria bacterium]
MVREVTRPGRYCGNEMNFPQKRRGRLKFLLCFPDLYDIGMSNMGLRILYHTLNAHPDVMADFAFAPWVDMEAFMRRENVPLSGVGTGVRAREFDVLGFSLQHELQYTNVLTMLDLAGIPLLAADRGEGDPVVVAGGPCAFNTEPMSDFIDAFGIGDGETVCVDIARTVQSAGSGGASRLKMLEMLSEVDGVYVPCVQANERASLKIRRRIEPVLRDEDFPYPPIVPIIPITHDRLTLEIMRGCTRGCRFCSAGMLTRPVRERSADSVVGLAERGIDASGWDEVSLVSLSTSDYDDLALLVGKLTRVLAERRVSISLPSMRPGAFSDEIARLIGRTKKTGLAFAPEAGSLDLRNAINKNVDENELFTTVETAFRNNWDSVKLYFMVGLPYETEGDMDGLVRMVRSVESICRGYGKRRKITVSLSPFVPRPHTPFQWEAQQRPETLIERISHVRKGLPDRRIKLKWRDPFMAQLEGLIARGDSRLGEVILRAWKAGSRFDSWTDRFDYDLWSRCLDESGIAFDSGFEARDSSEPLPWGHIDGGVSREFLLREVEKSASRELTPDCRDGTCSDCGACPDKRPPVRREERDPGRADRVLSGDSARRKPASVRIKFRIRYSKQAQMRLASHLDTVRCIQRGLRRSGAPVCYSEGFSPHPRISFGPPLPLGAAGESECLDIVFTRMPSNGWIDRLNDCLPKGLSMIESRVIGLNCPSLMCLVNAAAYSVEIRGNSGPPGEELASGIGEALSERGKIFSMTHRAEDGRLVVDFKVSIGPGSPGPEKVIEKILRESQVCYEIMRKDLFVEQDGVFSPAFMTERQEEKKV